MSYLILDLETIPDPELPAAPSADDRIAAGPHHKIVAAGALLLSDTYEPKGMRCDTTEPEALGKIVATLSAQKTSTKLPPTAGSGGLAATLVTFAGRRFDLPVVIARCFRHGIPFPRYFDSGRGVPDYRYRYAHEPHLDLLDVLSDFGSGRSPSLDALARSIGWPGKGDVDGGLVATLMRLGRLDEVIAYNLSDVVQTGAVLLRAQLLRGLLLPVDYKRAMGQLIDFTAHDPRTAPVAAKVDRSRALHLHEATS